MTKAKLVLCLTALLVAVVSTTAAEEKPTGTYLLSYLKTQGTVQVPLVLIKLENKEGKLTGKQVAINPRMARSSLGAVSLEGQRLRITIKDPGGELTFEGLLSPITTLGTLSRGATILPAQVAKSALETLELKNSETAVHLAPFDKAQEDNTKALRLRVQARREADEKKKAELLKQADDLDREIRSLDREILAKHADSPVVFMAGYRLLLGTKNLPERPTVAEARQCVETLRKAARAYGPMLEAETLMQVTERLATVDAYKELTQEYAQQTEHALAEAVSPEVQVDILKRLCTVLRKTNHTERLPELTERMAKLNTILDREYLARMPPFPPTPFAGRKAKSERVAVMELFTGAQCPPCVAADVAFDALEKTYPAKDVILLQYHMHIPRPDPLTNPDSEARWQYYRAKFPNAVSGTPTTIFNGKPKLGGGGPLDLAEVRYREYRGLLDALLEETSSVHLTAQANRQGSRITIKAEVTDLPEPGENKRLRFVLVEEVVPYAGSNRLRMHHHVVRAFPGGAEGMPLNEKTAQRTATLDLEQLRQQLGKYLDDYAKKQPFPDPDRPLDLKRLKVVALVQDDTTREILQAIQVDVAGEPASR